MTTVQTVPRAARESYQTRVALSAAAVSQARRLQPRGAAAIARAVTAYQVVAAQQGAASVPAILAEQGISEAMVAGVVATSLAGIASDGRPLESLFAQATSLMQLALMVVTQVQDAGRVGASLATVASRADGYVRMLNPPSCSRCAILAGRWYRWSAGFDRHPNCDCIHIPSNESVADDLRVNPNTYFDSLSRAEQDRLFTKAGAQAIRDGADISKVVNARRGGVEPAQVLGRTVLATTEGVTNPRNGRRLRASDGRIVRLMPESIYKLAKNREDAIRLLKLYGYLI